MENKKSDCCCPRSPNDTDAINSIDGDLAYYRNKAYWVQVYTVVAIGIVVYFHQAVEIANPIIELTGFVVFFIGVALGSIVLQQAYFARIDELRESKIELFDRAGITGVFPHPGMPGHSSGMKQIVRPNKVMYYLIILFASLAILIVWSSDSQGL